MENMINYEGPIYIDNVIDIYVDAFNEKINSIDYLKSCQIVPVSANVIFDVVNDLYIFFRACGIMLVNSNDEETVSSSWIPDDGTLRIMVPSKSELTIVFEEDGKEIPLCGTTAAKMVKLIWVAIIDRCFLRFKHEQPAYTEANLKIIYKEEEGEIPTYSNFTKIMDNSDHITKLSRILDMAAENPTYKEYLLQSMDAMNKLNWYGIVVEVGESFVDIYVPETSTFIAPGRTEPYAGEVAYDIAADIMRRIIPETLNTREMRMHISEGLHWNGKKYNEVYNSMKFINEEFEKMLDDNRR